MQPLELVPARPDFDRYLEDTIVVDWQTPAVMEQARRLAEGCASDLERARSIFEFVRDEIPNSLDHDTDVVTCSASDVLREGTGTSYAKCHLLAALLRARGIPAGFGYQRVRRSQGAGGHVLHGFVGAWLAEPGRWVGLDARGDTETIRTRFDIDEPSLAHAPDVEDGEETQPTLHARPIKRVIELLDRADSLKRIYMHMPAGIRG